MFLVVSVEVNLMCSFCYVRCNKVDVGSLIDSSVESFFFEVLCFEHCING